MLNLQYFKHPQQSTPVWFEKRGKSLIADYTWVFTVNITIINIESATSDCSNKFCKCIERPHIMLIKKCNSDMKQVCVPVLINQCTSFMIFTKSDEKANGKFFNKITAVQEKVLL